MAFKTKKSGFTLIELVMVMVIIAVLAAINLPKYISLNTTAMDKVDNYTISALNIALKQKYLENIVNGSSPENAHYTQSDFFSLLNNTPYQVVSSFNANTQDNKTWRIVHDDASDVYNICCPHFNGWTSTTGFYYNLKANGGRGCVWVYYSGDTLQPKGTLVYYAAPGH